MVSASNHRTISDVKKVAQPEGNHVYIGHGEQLVCAQILISMIPHSKLDVRIGGR
jgi:hypothetical protein